MPELPEVETIKRGLLKFILNKKIVQIEILERKQFIDNDDVFLSPRSSHLSLQGSAANASLRSRGPRGERQQPAQCAKKTPPLSSAVISIRRFGKALVIDLDNGYSLMIHLRMTGQLIWRGKENFAAGHPSENFVAELPNKQTRVIFRFTDGVLYFNDQRKFGFVKVLKTQDVEKDDFIKKLAKEPWQMDVKELYDKFQKHKNAPVKAVILDQSIIAGLGNIYADESLYFANVHPETKAGNLSMKQAEKILIGARTVMDASINSGGSTMATYVRADGTRGDYLEKFAKVFRREGQPCERCGTEIIKIKVAGRGTHICPECQKC